MPAFLVAEIDVADPARYETYKRLSDEALAKHGGRFLVRGGSPEGLEGGWSPRRIVVIEFADRAAVKRWFASPEYLAAREARAGIATFRSVVVDGA